jgi:hypothetical protein
LNSLPSAANSSLPSAGTVTLKSPRPSRCAACNSRCTSACSARATSSANTKARTRNASVSPSTAAVARVTPVRGTSASRWIVTGWPSTEVPRTVAVRYFRSSIVTCTPFLVGSGTSAAAGSVVAAGAPPWSIRVSTLRTRLIRFAYSWALAVDTVSRPICRPVSSCSSATAGATAVRLPVSNVPNPVTSSRIRLAPIRLASASSAARTLAALWSRSAEDSATSRSAACAADAACRRASTYIPTAPICASLSRLLTFDASDAPSNVNSTAATAIIGTITITAKNSRSRPRKVGWNRGMRTAR